MSLDADVTIVAGLYVGAPAILEPDGHRTGIFKQAVAEARVGRSGFDGDHQADRRYHGGPEKALHQFARAGYDRIAARFPQLREQAVPGSIGENISATAVTDETVCVGDIYRCGSALLQVSQPRRPCWKIDHRFGHDGIAAYVQSNAVTGWYLRVLEPGRVALGDALTLVARPSPEWTIAALNHLGNQHRPAPEALRAAAGATGLAADWSKRLADRAERLAR